jgi:hypothetical protein
MTHEPRPMRKSTVPIYQLGDSLYLNTSGYITEVPDPTGSIAALLDRMDGTRTVRQLHDELHGMYPTVTLREIEAAIAQFDRAGFLEDATHGPEGLLDAYELARWQRNINFLGSFTPMEGNKYELQARIKSARVALLGLGGLGSHLLLDLAALGVQHIRAAEFDKVELSNLNRQILYTDADVGRPKMEVAAERIRAFSPRLRFESFPSRLGSTEDVRKVISGCQYVVCVADRPKMEIIRCRARHRRLGYAAGALLQHDSRRERLCGMLATAGAAPRSDVDRATRREAAPPDWRRQRGRGAPRLARGWSHALRACAADHQRGATCRGRAPDRSPLFHNGDASG